PTLFRSIGASSGPVSGAAFQAAYAISSSSANGRETMTVASGEGGNAVIYMISATAFVAVSLNDPNPAVLLFEQSATSPPPTPTLTSLTLSPTSVRSEEHTSELQSRF